MGAIDRREVGMNCYAPVTIFEAMKASKSGMQPTVKDIVPGQILKEIKEEGIKKEYRFSLRHSF
jgi:hypothetical protein